MTGTGTQADPYVVETWAEFLSVCDLSNTTYVEWSNAEVDFNEIQPEGFTSSISMRGNITFTNIEFKNFTTRSGDAWIMEAGTINYESCKFTDFYQVYANSRSMYLLHAYDACNGVYFTNCEFTMLQTNALTSNTNNSIPFYGSKIKISKCAFTVEASTGGYWTITNGTIEFSNINLKITARRLGAPLPGFVCWYSGKFVFSEGTSSSSSGYDGDFIIDIECNQTIACTANNGAYKFLVLYNSDKATITGTNIVGVTTAQLQDSDYLYSLGFPAKRTVIPNGS